MVIPKECAIDSLKSASKWAIRKTAEATGDLIGNKIADKITKLWRSSSQTSSEIVESETENSKFYLKKNLKEDIYFQKKCSKLLMI